MIKKVFYNIAGVSILATALYVLLLICAAGDIIANFLTSLFI